MLNSTLFSIKKIKLGPRKSKFGSINHWRKNDDTEIYIYCCANSEVSSLKHIYTGAFAQQGKEKKTMMNRACNQMDFAAKHF